MTGLFIGSFNPPTLAHFEICLKLLENLEEIILIPVNSKEKQLIDINRRIEMLNIYANKNSNIKVDSIMKDYSYCNYHIIDLLKAKYQNITIIMGSDLLDKLDTFDNYEYLLQAYSFIIIERCNYHSMEIIKKKYSMYQDKFSIIDYDSDISSTKARKLLKEKKDVKDILDKDVLEYIKKHVLY